MSASSALERFNEWAREGRYASISPEFGDDDLSALPELLLGALGTEEGGIDVVDLLLGLAHHPSGAFLAARVFALGAHELITKLESVPLPTVTGRREASADEGINPVAVWAVLRSAPTLARPLDGKEILGVLTAGDVSLFRYILQWATHQPDDNSTGWHFGDDPPAPTIGEFVAEALRRSRFTRNPSEGPFECTSSGAIHVARRCFVSINPEPPELTALQQRIWSFVRRHFETTLDAAVELRKLDARVARHAVGLEGVDTLGRWTQDWLAKVAKVNHLNPDDVGSPRGFELMMRAVKVVPVEHLSPEILIAEAGLDQDVDGGSRGVQDRWRSKARKAYDRRIVTMGVLCGTALFKRAAARDKSHILQMLSIPSGTATGTTHAANENPVSAICDVAITWADLLQVAKYEEKRWDHKNEIRGVGAQLMKSIEEMPQAWARSAATIVAKRNLLGDTAIDLLTLAAARHSTVYAAIEQITSDAGSQPESDFARGILAGVGGDHSPGDEMRRWLADAAARAFDGAPMFPNPLTTLSRTWLGSTALESVLSSTITRAVIKYGPQLQNQGGADERLLTGVLLDRLVTAFEDMDLRLAVGGQAKIGRTISIDHRPTRDVEEKRWGCDLVLLLHVAIHPDVAIDAAELVQVKKSDAMSAAAAPGTLGERWRIDTAQLSSIIGMSETASYWLLCHTGEVLCVPARWLLALGTGRGALNQATFTVGYNDARHVAVSLAQFIAELFLGLWVGTRNQDVLEFAAGNNPNLVPAHVLEIVVTSEQG